jgi:hypothetical protein
MNDRASGQRGMYSTGYARIQAVNHYEALYLTSYRNHISFNWLDECRSWGLNSIELDES